MADYTDWNQWARRMQARVPAVREAFRRATTEATHALHQEAKTLLKEQIYDKPIDETSFSYRRRSKKRGGGFITGKDGKRSVSSKGRKKWRRSSNLRNSESKRVLSDYEGAVDNSAEYALARHDLGLSPGDPRAIKGSRRRSERIAPWRRDAIAKTERERAAIYRKHLADALKR